MVQVMRSSHIGTLRSRSETGDDGATVAKKTSPRQYTDQKIYPDGHI